MAPRKTRSSAKEGAPDNESQEAERTQDVREEGQSEGQSECQSEGSEDTKTAGDKRKKSPPPDEANKVSKAKKSDQATKAHDTEGSESTPSPEQVLKFLLSDAALDVCRPEDEAEYVSEHGKETTTYAQLLSPFEELLCAVVLSRPISHRLGLRTIRTILNPPYEFRDADTIKSAGAGKIHQALDDARTQHKGKTTEEIELIAEAVTNNDWHDDLEKIRKQTKNAVDEEREVLRKSIKGLGKTGLNIFYRRVQWLWDEAYPFIDARTQDSLEKLGLPKQADELVEFIEKKWQNVKFDDSGEFNDDERKRRAFVLLLERAVGSDLEKRTDDVLAAAVRS